MSLDHLLECVRCRTLFSSDVFPDTSGPWCSNSVSPPLAQAQPQWAHGQLWAVFAGGSFDSARPQAQPQWAYGQLWAVFAAGSFDSAKLTLSMALGVHVRIGCLPFFIL